MIDTETEQRPEENDVELSIGDILGKDNDFLDSLGEDNLASYLDQLWQEQPEVRRLVSEVYDYHPDTGRHLARVGLLSGVLATEYGFDEEDIKLAMLGGLLHDIGKLKTPLPILDSTERFDEDSPEMAEMRKHPEEGLRMVNESLKESSRLSKAEIAKLKHVVLCHHLYNQDEEKDSYPDTPVVVSLLIQNAIGDRFTNIEITGIVAIADHYDAMTSRVDWHDKPVSPEFVTRQLEISYSKPVNMGNGSFSVGKLIDFLGELQERRQPSTTATN